MGLLAAAPIIGKVGGALLGGLFAKKSQQSAMKRSPEEQLALGGAQQAAQGLSTTGQDLIQGGRDAQRPAQNYFQTLLQGSRPAMMQAVAGPTAALTDVYRGAERGLERSGVQGAARDVASADLTRQKASQISSLITGVQPGAAQQLAGMGAQQVGQGIGAVGAGANAFGNLLGAGAQNRIYGRQEGAETGKNVGGLIFDLLSGTMTPKGGGGVLPSRQTVPSWSNWLPR